MGFSYAIHNIATGDIEPDHRSLNLPFGTNDPDTDNSPSVPSRSQPQCTMITDDDESTTAVPEEISLYGYMAFGGTSPEHDITMADGEGMDVAHQFVVAPDDDGIGMLLTGQPNTKAADYTWTLNARDTGSDQPNVSRTWKLRVAPEAYMASSAVNLDGNQGVEPAAATTRAADETDAEWADFISSTYSGALELDQNGVRGGVPAILNLTASGSVKFVKGRIDPAVDDVDDVDVFWLGPLTPDSVITVMVKRETEFANSPGLFNDVDLALHSFVMDAMKSDPEMAGMSAMEGFYEYKDLDCGSYYLEVSSSDGDEGEYTLTWVVPVPEQ